MTNFEYATFAAGLFTDVNGVVDRMDVTLPDGTMRSFVGVGGTFSLVVGLNSLGKEGWEFAGSSMFGEGNGTSQPFGILKRQTN